MERAYRGKGLGNILLAALMKKAVELGFHKLVLSVMAYNTQAIALYRKHGFREVGVYKDHGRIDGQWQDVVLMEKIL